MVTTKKEPKLDGRRLYPWEQIAEDFVKGSPSGDGRVVYPTLKDLMAKYGCSYIQIRRVADMEEWLDQRKACMSEQKRLAKDKFIEDIEKAAKHFDATSLDVAQSGINHILSHFRQVEADDQLVHSGELDRLGRAFMSFQKAGRLVLGLSTENNSNKTKVEGVAQEAGIDVTKLSERELEILEIIARRLEDRESGGKVVPMRKRSAS